MRLLQPVRVLALLLLLTRSAGATVGESPVFSFDTRDAVTAAVGESAVFAFDTRAIDGLGDDSSTGTFVLDTRSYTGSGLIVVGPASIAPGAQAEFQALMVSGGVATDVTASSTFSLGTVALTGIGIGGNSVFAGLDTAPQTIYLVATCRNLSGQTVSAPLAVTIAPAVRAGFTAQAVNTGGTSYTITLTGSAAGGVTPYLFRWDTNNDQVYGDVTGAAASFQRSSSGENWPVGLEVTDGNGTRQVRRGTVVLEKPPVGNEPRTFKPAFYLSTSVVKDADSNDGNFSAARAGNGLVVLTHGMRADWNSLDSQNRPALPHMAQQMRSRISSTSMPNILIYGWGADSDAAPYPAEAVERAKKELEVLGDISALVGVNIKTWKLKLLASITGWLSDLAVDCWYARNNYALPHGLELANLITEAEKQGLASKTAPIHLIGHSAGGFVMGHCGKILRARGFNVCLVTMLDTPFPEVAHLQTPRCGRMVDRYVATFYGTLDMPAGYRVQPAVDYFYGLTSDWSPLAFTWTAHGKAHEWYSDATIDDPGAASGFRFSPFCPNSLYPLPIYPPPAEAALFAFPSDAADGGSSDGSAGGGSAPAPSASALGGFQTFGQVAESGGDYTLTESSHAGIFKEMTFPTGTESIRFQCRFTVAGDGDQLVVYAGAEPILTVPDLPVMHGGFLEFDAPLFGLDGLTETITLKLVSRGTANAVVNVKDISLVVNDDPDANGFTTAQENTLGTDPLKFDSDGDGLGDGDEVSVYFTNPQRADSDGDGLGDSAELAAGTSPTNGQSFFHVTNVTRNTNGTLTLNWTPTAGRAYNVQRSTDVTFATYEVIGQGLAATAPQNTFVDTTAGAAPQGRYFYRVEVYVP